MLRLFKLLKVRDFGMIFVGIILITLGVMLDLKLPDYMSDLTNLFYTPGYQLQDIVLAWFKNARLCIR